MHGDSRHKLRTIAKRVTWLALALAALNVAQVGCSRLTEGGKSGVGDRPVESTDAPRGSQAEAAKAAPADAVVSFASVEALVHRPIEELRRLRGARVAVSGFVTESFTMKVTNQADGFLLTLANVAFAAPGLSSTVKCLGTGRAVNPGAGVTVVRGTLAVIEDGRVILRDCEVEGGPRQGQDSFTAEELYAEVGYDEPHPLLGMIVTVTGDVGSVHAARPGVWKVYVNNMRRAFSGVSCRLESAREPVTEHERIRVRGKLERDPLFEAELRLSDCVLLDQ